MSKSKKPREPVDEEFSKDLEEIRTLDAYKVLSQKLTDAQIVFVWRSFGGDGGLCGSCWEQGPYCSCYESRQCE